MRAVHFGAGNIGRGFLGQLYFESGYHTTFVDVDPQVIRLLNERQEYPLRIVDNDGSTTQQIANVNALSGRDLQAVAVALADANIASTAVGVNILPHIAEAIARGVEIRLSNRAEPLDIIVCENMVNAGDHLRTLVREHLPAGCHDDFHKLIGFVDASIGRMVPVMTEAQRAEDPLLVCVEAYCELPVDAEGFRGPIPPIRHLLAKQNFLAYVERKLYVHNMSHAATAYLGFLRGHEFIWQAIADETVRSQVEGAMWESCRAISAKHGTALEELEHHRDDLLKRYENRGLADQVSRVARDPIRKLGPKDRFIGAAAVCEAQRIVPTHIALATAAAMRYSSPDDTTARELQKLFAAGGVAGVLREVCHIDPASSLGELISRQAQQLDEW